MLVDDVVGVDLVGVVVVAPQRGRGPGWRVVAEPARDGAQALDRIAVLAGGAGESHGGALLGEPQCHATLGRVRGQAGVPALQEASRGHGDHRRNGPFGSGELSGVGQRLAAERAAT